MSARIRLVVSDIDGTLVRQDKSLSDGVVAAVQRLRDAGVAFSLISARPPSGMLWIAAKLGLTGKIASFNGGTIVKPDGEVVSAELIHPKTAACTLNIFNRPNAETWLFADGNWYARTTRSEYFSRERKAANVEPVVVSNFDGLLARVDKIVAISNDSALLTQLDNEVAFAIGAAATVSRSQTYYLDVTAPRGNKGDGIAALAAEFGFPLQSVAVFGDQSNDLAMFARAGMSVAMGQASEEVQAAATHVSRSNEDEGVADAIDCFVLPKVRQ
ncbi:MAG: Cof-type HAD-IIB family hydrolase [Croceibacterium sp.]